MEIGKKIKDLRLERGLTQNFVAEKTGISRSVLSQYENGLVEPKALVVKKLASFFDISTDYLLGLEDDFGVRVADAPTAAGELSAEEQQIIADYRSLSPGLKDMIKRTLDIYTNKSNTDA